MSVLKQAFEGILLRHLTDYRNELNGVLFVHDLTHIVVDYLINEEAFETELILLAAISGHYTRLCKLIMNSKNTYVKQWLRYFWNLVNYHACKSLLVELKDGLLLAAVRKGCNRPCCWNHKVSDLEDGECICQQPLTRGFLHTEQASQIFVLFPTIPNRYE